LVIANAIADPTFRFTRISDGFVVKDTPPPPPPGKLVANGTVVYEGPTDPLPGVKVEVEGTPDIVIGEGQNGPYRKCTIPGAERGWFGELVTSPIWGMILEDLRGN
jgi:hypothetical protein